MKRDISLYDCLSNIKYVVANNIFQYLEQHIEEIEYIRATYTEDWLEYPVDVFQYILIDDNYYDYIIENTDLPVFVVWKNWEYGTFVWLTQFGTPYTSIFNY